MVRKTFTNFLEEKRTWYKSVGSVYCPILNEHVHFTSKGFHHLRYKSSGKARTQKEQKYKMGLLPLTIPVIQLATSVFDYKKYVLKMTLAAQRYGNLKK